MNPVVALNPALKKNDKLAYWLIAVFSVIVFAVVVLLGQVELDVQLGFDVHVFALINAVLNSVIALLLIAALIAVKNKNWHLHKQIMLVALVLSVLFLLSYIAHHLLAGDTRFGDTDADGMVSAAEAAAAGSMRYVYLVVLLTHIFLAAFILPLILFTAYRGLTGEYSRHKRIARITWPLWLYVAITGPLVYWLISPYYH